MRDFILNAVEKEVNKCGHQDERRLYRSLIKQAGFWRSELKTYLVCYFTQTHSSKAHQCDAGPAWSQQAYLLPFLLSSEAQWHWPEKRGAPPIKQLEPVRLMYCSDPCTKHGESHIFPGWSQHFSSAEGSRALQSWSNPMVEGTSLHSAIHMTSSREEPNPWQYEALNSTLTCTSWGRCTQPHIIHLCVLQSLFQPSPVIYGSNP